MAVSPYGAGGDRPRPPSWGITDPADVRLRLEDSQFPNEVDVLLDMEYETLSDLNELAEAMAGLSKADMEKLGAVVMLAGPKSAAQIKNLAESLDLFDFAPSAHTPEDYGKYMIHSPATSTMTKISTLFMTMKSTARSV